MRRGRLGMGAAVVALLAATVGVLTVTAAPAGADTRDVANDTDYRAALSTLSGLGGGPHVINITADFAITLAGDPTYTGTEPLIINGHGHTINGGNAHRILNHNTPQALTVNNLTLTNATTDGSGGAIYAEGPVTVNDSTFTGNTATGFFASGGAIVTSGSVTVNDSTFTHNTAACCGGLSTPPGR